MAFKPKFDGFWGEVLALSWPMAAVLAFISFSFAWGLTPLLFGGDPLFAPIRHGLAWLAYGLALALAVLALCKWHWQRSDHSDPFVDSPLPQVFFQSLRYRHKPLTPPALSPWTLATLQQVEWKRFEELCAAYFREKGLLCRMTPPGPDGGIDIRLYQDPEQPERTTALVQCKAMRRVGIKPMREFLGVVVNEKLSKGFFMTSGEFTDESKAFAHNNRLIPIDGALMLTMILRLPEDAQQRLFTLATAGDWTTPTCPQCGYKMQRKDPPTGKPFWGCPRARCKGRLDMRHEQF